MALGVTTKLAERLRGPLVRPPASRCHAGGVLGNRLGRKYKDVSDNIRAFMRRGVIIQTKMNGMTFDGA